MWWLKPWFLWGNYPNSTGWNLSFWNTSAKPTASLCIRSLGSLQCLQISILENHAYVLMNVLMFYVSAKKRWTCANFAQSCQVFPRTKQGVPNPGSRGSGGSFPQPGLIKFHNSLIRQLGHLAREEDLGCERWWFLRIQKHVTASNT